MGLGTRPAPTTDRAPQWRAATIRTIWIVLAVAALASIYPWRSVDNAEEIAAAQSFVDSMSVAHDAVAGGRSVVADFTIADHGFVGFETVTPGGVPATGLIGPIGNDCLVMHWTAPEIAQVGRLPSNRPCSPGEITVVPLQPNNGYVPGTGPPFDVTSLIREAHTPIWFVAAAIVLAWVVIKAGLDIFLIFLRPDHFFAED